MTATTYTAEQIDTMTGGQLTWLVAPEAGYTLQVIGEPTSADGRQVVLVLERTTPAGEVNRAHIRYEVWSVQTSVSLLGGVARALQYDARMEQLNAATPFRSLQDAQNSATAYLAHDTKNASLRAARDAAATDEQRATDAETDRILYAHYGA